MGEGGGRVYLGQGAIKDREVAGKPLDLQGLPICPLLYPPLCPKSMMLQETVKVSVKIKVLPVASENPRDFGNIPARLKAFDQF